MKVETTSEALLTLIFTECYYDVFSLCVLTVNLLHVDISQVEAGKDSRGV